ncbi:MAG: 16S rRNA (guanine(966)-N(2))-methyltransferase RsmD [Panacagrimonas sp.]
MATTRRPLFAVRRPSGQLRIIGGRWRSRRLLVPQVEGLRPTPDRVRQTLFDWLAPRVCGACALDLFAGSGALGLEALSRDAAVVRFVEQSPVALAAIRDSVATLGAVERSRVEQAEALSWLGATAARPNRDDEKFELVFLDPPYASGLLEPCLNLLPPLLSANARIYVEWPLGQTPKLPPGYAWIREKSAGRVSYGLLIYR